MVDDNVVARPQFGFNAASIVYQAPADGGEDRYMLVFQENDASRIEPVRSGRPYFVKWAAEYRAGFAHYGGDLKTIRYLSVVNRKLVFNLDALHTSAPAFHRDRSRSRPHNAVTATDALRRVGTRRLGYPQMMVAGLPARPFANDVALADRPAGGSIRIPYNRGATTYTYDRDSNSYLRSVAGRPQFDAADHRRVTARNVVVLFMTLGIDPDSERGYHRPLVGSIGSGRAIVFRDGRAIEGTWRKRDDADLTRFFDKAGAEIPLVRGRIFVQIVPIGTKVTFKAAA